MLHRDVSDVTDGWQELGPATRVMRAMTLFLRKLARGRPTLTNTSRSTLSSLGPVSRVFVVALILQILPRAIGVGVPFYNCTNPTELS